MKKEVVQECGICGGKTRWELPERRTRKGKGGKAVTGSFGSSDSVNKPPIPVAVLVPVPSSNHQLHQQQLPPRNVHSTRLGAPPPLPPPPPPQQTQKPNQNLTAKKRAKERKKAARGALLRNMVGKTKDAGGEGGSGAGSGGLGGMGLLDLMRLGN